ncbi:MULTISPECIES: Cof-type HAD-IIB family hydrolase [Bacillaceae]|uniref:Phosphoglycolate phosphatase n=1 Tax=Peribacillus huizhouensis TaxID=1501239 RepID=A0ABR6CPR3_9BACI|nr:MULTISPECIES: Cof-type HAD-IIB family hydrolase [Bacillaceae]MBA9027029.1 hypothetical protein [Peribacillus huizhouensis]
MSEYILKNEIKLIALDMDGTLLDPDNKVTEENRQAIKAAEGQGVHVVLSTGRTFATCSDYAKSLELSSYLVTVNGSEIYNEQGKLVERNIIQTDFVKWMLDICNQFKTDYWAVSCDRVYRDDIPEDLFASEWLKFGFNTSDNKAREEIIQLLKGNGQLEVSNSSPTNIEVNALGINKAKAIEVVCNRLGINMNEVMAVGDSLNDIMMIKEAGLGVAMGNAQEIVKETADWITATNEENGVAKAIEKWVLKS